MDWQGLRRKILADHQHQPQTLGRLELALNQASEALQIMAGHGYRYHLAEGPGEAYPEWPRMLYHVDNAPNGIKVYTEKEAEELGPGYFDSFQKAQFWDGLETQFNGRGGVPKSPRVPVPLLLCKTYDDPEEEQRRRDLIAAFRALNKWEKPHALEERSTAENDERREALRKVQEKDGNSAEGGERIRSGGQGSEQEAFKEALSNFGGQGMKIELVPPSMREEAPAPPAESGESPESEPEAVTLRDIEGEALKKEAAE